MRKALTLILLNLFVISASFAESGPGTSNFTSFSRKQAKVTPELQALTKSEFKSHPEFGVLPYNAPCTDCIELLQERTEKSRYFVKEGTNGSEFFSQTAYNQLNYRDAAGHLATIDYRLKPAAQQGVFSAVQQPFPVTVNLKDKYVSILNDGKEILVNRNITISIKNPDGSLTSMGTPSWTNYTAGDDGVIVHDLYPGIDLELHVGTGNVESFYRINKPLNLKGTALVIHDNMQLPSDLNYDFSYAEAMQNGLYEGSLFIKNAAGTNYFIMGSPAAYDENGVANNYSISLQYGIDKVKGMDLYVPISWMNDAGRSYPVLIDPFVTATSTLPASSISGSGYNATCFTGGCTYNLGLTVPAACTVADITTTFWFRALGTCNLNQGAWDIKTGSCRYPTTGQFNGCNIGLPGLCQLSDLSCFNEVKSCITPSCQSYDIPFILTFYRCVQPGSGCGFSCINVDQNTPWSMTVRGYKMNVSASGSTTICQGTSATLTAASDSGIAPYSYKWYPGGLTGNPVNVSPATTTTYTVTGSTCGGLDSAQATVTVTVKPNFATAGPDTSVCSGNPVQINTSGPSGATYSWSPAAGLSNSGIANPVATPTVTTTYTLTTTTNGCTATATVTIIVTPGSGGTTPNIIVNPDISAYSIAAGDSVSFDVTVTGSVNSKVYLTANSSLLNGGFNTSFSPPDSGLTSITRSFLYISSCNDSKSSPFTIQLKGTSGTNSACGTAKDTTYNVEIKVSPPNADLLDTIPNIFTPNGDNKNDNLTLYHLDKKSTNCWNDFSIKIFNRWGELQYESTDFSFRWNGNNKAGTKVSEGVYYYIITGTYLGDTVTKKGTVNVKL